VQGLFAGPRNRLECKVMSGPRSSPIILWSSKPRFFLAAFGALTGLDTFSEFPYLLAHYGGATFVGAYVLGLLCVAWPLLAAELTLGRRSRAAGGIAHIQSGLPWRLALGGAIVGGFLMFCYVAVISGWMLAYVRAVLMGDFRAATPPFVAAHFDSLVVHPWPTLLWEAVFLLLVLPVVAGGIRAIEELARFLVPGMFALLVGLAAYAATRGSFFVAAPLLLYPNKVLDPQVVGLLALSQVFFGPSLGAASLLAYGFWLPSSVSPVRSALALVLAQGAVAWLGGFALASLAFAVGLRPLAGGSFLFETLPLVSARLPAGEIVAALCYIALIAAAWLSVVAWLEPAVQVLGRRGLSRARSAWGLGVAAFALGAVLTLSLNSWAFSFTFFGHLKTLGLLDVLVIAAVNILLPAGGGGLSALIGWGRPGLVGPGGHVAKGYRVWQWSLRILVPTAVLVVILSAPRLIL